MLNLKNTLTSFLIITLSIASFAQDKPYEIVLSGGTGASLSNMSLKGITNLGLQEAGLDSKVQTTMLVNGMLDVCISKNISIGLAYTHKQFYWTDAFEDTIQNTIVQSSATISTQKRNYGLRVLYHHSSHENFEFYTGLRVGLTHWKINISGKTNAETLFETPVSDFNLPATYPSIQALAGFRHYFGRVFGWFGELGIGSSPYFCSVGLNVRFNPIK